VWHTCGAGVMRNFKKIVIPPTSTIPAYGFVTYLMEYDFTFTFSSREFQATCICCIVCDSINRPGDLDLLTCK